MQRYWSSLRYCPQDCFCRLPIFVDNQLYCLTSADPQTAFLKSIESRIRPKGGFGSTLGKLLTLSKPDLYPKSVLTPAQKLRQIPNL